MSKKIAEDLLEKIPYGSEEWTKHRQKISKQLESKYPGQYVLCVPGKLEKPDLGIHQGEYQEWNTETAHKMFGAQKHFFGKNVRFVKRSKAEYNLEYKQVNVFCCIEDSEGSVVLLKKKNGEYHFPGGHVDFSFQAYLSTPEQILRSAIIQELEEELRIKQNEMWALFVPEKPSAVINTETRWNDLFHLAVIFHVKLNCKAEELKLKSGEPDKHDIVIFKGWEKEIPTLNTKKGEYIHDWVRSFVGRNNITMRYTSNVEFTSTMIENLGGEVK